MRCPVCRAEVELGPQCRRCRADLTLMTAVEQQREQALTAARRYLSTGQWSAAVASASQAHQLRGDAESARLIAIGHLLRRDFAGAWQWHRRAGA